MLATDHQRMRAPVAQSNVRRNGWPEGVRKVVKENLGIGEENLFAFLYGHHHHSTDIY